MNEYLIQTADPSAYPPEDFRCVVRTGQVNGDTVLDILHTEDPTLPGDSLIGAWERGGTVPEGVVVDEVAYDAIRPLGNLPEQEGVPEGLATMQLLYHHFAGWGQRQLGDPAATDPVLRFYPNDNQPFAIEMRHKEFTGNANPEWDGWGWRAEIIGGAESRDPSARAIGVYSDADCTQYLYTTGAYVLQDSDWQTDEGGDPIQVWATETPVGRANPDREDWHLACLLGSAQEGRQTLPAQSDGIEYLFWDHVQGAPPPTGDTWVDSGATITAQAGTVYQISDEAVAAALVVGQAIRLGDDAETTFNGVWSGGASYIQIDPFVQAAVGDILWYWG